MQMKAEPYSTPVKIRQGAITAATQWNIAKGSGRVGQKRNEIITIGSVVVEATAAL